MTVQELIDELQKIEDKTLQIQYVDNEFGNEHISEVYKNTPHAWNNPLDPERPYYTLQP